MAGNNASIEDSAEHRFTLRLPSKLMREIESFAFLTHGSNSSALIIEAVQTYLARQKSSRPEVAAKAKAYRALVRSAKDSRATANSRRHSDVP